MQYVLKVFEYEESRKFRTIERDGEPWFVLADVCRELEIGNPSQAASRLDDDEKHTLTTNEGGKINGLGGTGSLPTIINESGLYSLILTSRKPAAKKFKKWITAEVLPAIRKTGSYGKPKSIPAFVRRYNENWDRTDKGYFSVISELFIRIWGRFEQVGYIMADKAADGTEIRMDISVGKQFSAWLSDKHPHVSGDFTYYLHKTSKGEFPARQYPLHILPLYVDFLENTYLIKHLPTYIGTRDPAALPYLPQVLAVLDKPKAGMTRRVTGATPIRKAKPQLPKA